MAAQAMSLFVFALVAACGVAWTRTLQGWSRRLPAVTGEPRDPVPWTLIDLGATALCLLVVGIVCVQTTASLIGVSLHGSWSDVPARQRAALMLAESLGSCITVVLSLAFVQVRAGASWRDLGVVPERWWHDIGMGMIGFVMLAPPVYLMQWALVHWIQSKHPLVEVLQNNPDRFTITVTLLSAVVVAPVAEEYFFRVLLQGWLEKLACQLHRLPDATAGVAAGQSVPAADPEAGESAAFADAGPSAHGSVPVDCIGAHGAWDAQENPFKPPVAIATAPETRTCSAVWPILISSAIFALLHYQHGPDWIPLFFFAIGLGYVYRQTHRVVPCIVIHGLLNACSMGMFFVAIFD